MRPASPPTRGQLFSGPPRKAALLLDPPVRGPLFFRPSVFYRAMCAWAEVMNGCSCCRLHGATLFHMKVRSRKQAVDDNEKFLQGNDVLFNVLPGLQFKRLRSHCERSLQCLTVFIVRAFMRPRSARVTTSASYMTEVFAAHVGQPGLLIGLATGDTFRCRPPHLDWTPACGVHDLTQGA